MPNSVRVKCFVELCRQENYTRAAERLYITQPALSRHISLLEQELGVKLIRHNKKHFQLTPEGTAFLKLAKEFQEQVDAFKQASHSLKANINATLKIGYFRDFPISKMLQVEREMREIFPDLLIDFKAYYYQTQILSDLLQGDLDIGLAFRCELGTVPNFHYEVIAVNYISVIMSDRHRLWGAKSISPEELQGESLYIPIQELCPSGFFAVINFLQKHEIFLRSNCCDSCIEEQLLRVARGDCLSLSHMYGSDLIECTSGRFVRVPVRSSDIHDGDITLVYPNATAEITKLTECLRRAFPEVEIV